MKADSGARASRVSAGRDGHDDGAIRFVGTPRNLRARLPVAVERASSVPVALTIDGSLQIHRAVWRARSSSTSEMVLRLPAATGVGEYMGEATVEGKQQAVIVSVVAQPGLIIFPERTVLSTVAGARETFTLTVANSGNVSVTLPADGAIDMDDDDAQDRALGRSLRAELTTNERRVDRFFEELRLGHGGQAYLTVTRGSGELLPAESREVVCVVDVPKAVRPGHQYGGSWEFGVMSHEIVLNAKESDVNTTPDQVSHEVR